MPDWALCCSSTTSSAGFWRGFGAAPSSWLQADAKPSHCCHVLSNELRDCRYHMPEMQEPHLGRPLQAGTMDRAQQMLLLLLLLACLPDAQRAELVLEEVWHAAAPGPLQP